MSSEGYMATLLERLQRIERKSLLQLRKYFLRKYFPENSCSGQERLKRLEQLVRRLERIQAQRGDIKKRLEMLGIDPEQEHEARKETSNGWLRQMLQRLWKF